MSYSINHSSCGSVKESSAQQKVVLIGGNNNGCSSLAHQFSQLHQTITCLASYAEIDFDLLADAALIFFFVSDLPRNIMIEKIDTIVRQVRYASVIPIIEYADQDRIGALLEIGCVDYLLSPFSSSQLSALIRRQVATSIAQEGFVSCSQSGRRLLAMAQRVATTRAPILITGETGTGKEMVARYIHRFGGNDKAPFVSVNCAAIPEQMLESILFGHERGAFTGALSSQPGKFELASGGTLLLDEVGELPLALQAKLLRVLQERRVERLGARGEIELDVRIIAATNRDLAVEVAEGRFRSDLMFRLDVLPLHITPLRERVEDILPLARSFIEKYAPHEQGDCLLTEAACRAMLNHDWPGNVRELENTLQRALVLRNGLFIQPQDLGLTAPLYDVHALPERQVELISGRATLRAAGKWAEYQHVLDTIRKCDGHKNKAAQRLGMTPRALRYRLSAMRELGVEVPS